MGKDPFSIHQEEQREAAAGEISAVLWDMYSHLRMRGFTPEESMALTQVHLQSLHAHNTEITKFKMAVELRDKLEGPEGL